MHGPPPCNSFPAHSPWPDHPWISAEHPGNHTGGHRGVHPHTLQCRCVSPEQIAHAKSPMPRRHCPPSQMGPSLAIFTFTNAHSTCSDPSHRHLLPQTWAVHHCPTPSARPSWSVIVRLMASWIAGLHFDWHSRARSIPYAAGRMVLAAAGSVDHEELVAAARSAFASLPADSTSASELVAAEPSHFTGSAVAVRDPDSPATTLAIAFQGSGWLSPDSVTLQARHHSSTASNCSRCHVIGTCREVLAMSAPCACLCDRLSLACPASHAA